MVHIINDIGEYRKNILEAKFRLQSRANVLKLYHRVL